MVVVGGGGRRDMRSCAIRERTTSPTPSHPHLLSQQTHSIKHPGAELSSAANRKHMEIARERCQAGARFQSVRKMFADRESTLVHLCGVCVCCVQSVHVPERNCELAAVVSRLQCADFFFFCIMCV